MFLIQPLINSLNNSITTRRPYVNNVLLSGASGTGKSLLLQALGNTVAGHNAKLIRVNDRKKLETVVSIVKGTDTRPIVVLIDDLMVCKIES